MTIEERDAAYQEILARELGLSRADRQRPPSELFLVLLRELERRGKTLEDAMRWMEDCSLGPDETEASVACFQTRAQTELRQPPSLLRVMAAAAGTAFVVYFVWARR